MKKLFLILLASAWLPFLVSCLKDKGEGTIVLMGSESYVHPIEEVIPDTLLRFLEVHGMHCPEGNNPPDIQGEYVLYPRRLKWTNADAIPANDSLFFRFGGDLDTLVSGGDTLVYHPFGQHGRVTPCDYKESYFDMNHADTVYLMGNGDRFTAYYVMTFRHINSSPGTDFDLTRGFVITGRPSADRILHAAIACINMKVDVNKNDPAISGVSTALLKKMEGRIYVYEGPVFRQQWYGKKGAGR